MRLSDAGDDHHHVVLVGGAQDRGSNAMLGADGLRLASRPLPWHVRRPRRRRLPGLPWVAESISVVACSSTASGRATRPAPATSWIDVQAVMTTASTPGNMRATPSTAPRRAVVPDEDFAHACVGPARNSHARGTIWPGASVAHGPSRSEHRDYEAGGCDERHQFETPRAAVIPLRLPVSGRDLAGTIVIARPR